MPTMFLGVLYQPLPVAFFHSREAEPALRVITVGVESYELGEFFGQPSSRLIACQSVILSQPLDHSYDSSVERNDARRHRLLTHGTSPGELRMRFEAAEGEKGRGGQ